jgi:hypothetical protein
MIFKILFIMSKIFFLKFVISKFCKILLFTLFLEFAQIFPFFSKQKLPN